MWTQLATGQQHAAQTAVAAAVGAHQQDQQQQQLLEQQQQAMRPPIETWEQQEEHWARQHQQKQYEETEQRQQYQEAEQRQQYEEAEQRHQYEEAEQRQQYELAEQQQQYEEAEQRQQTTERREYDLETAEATARWSAEHEEAEVSEQSIPSDDDGLNGPIITPRRELGTKAKRPERKTMKAFPGSRTSTARVDATTPKESPPHKKKDTAATPSASGALAEGGVFRSAGAPVVLE